MIGKERPQPPDPFGFTEREKLYDQISDKRFQALIHDPGTSIHKVGIDTNNYGEFVFVTLSRELQGHRTIMTFWGLGYHEYRERWITHHWRWYSGNQFPAILKQSLSLEATQVLLAQRQADIASDVSAEDQSNRAQLYELLADLTDEDGAYSELEDLGAAALWLLADETDARDTDDDLPATKPLFDTDTE
ncbi:MAG: hypothetical protein CL610_16610 [Anaerolineaceae bacterium]|nr:hypothetical protein [Anaerolineaceae bacterium]